MAEAPLKTDLILKGRIADFPITVCGTLENGDFAGFSGSITIKKTLAEILSALGFNPRNTKDPAKILNDLTGGLMSKIALDSLAVGYRGLGTKFTQIVVTMTAGGNTFRFVILKLTAGGFVVGLDLLWDPEFFKNNVLSGLVGEISIKDLGLYYASQDFTQVKYDAGRDFQDVNTLVPSIPETGERAFNEGLNWSAKLLVGQINLLDWPGLEKEDIVQRVKSAILQLPPDSVSDEQVAKQLNLEVRDLQNSLRIKGTSVRALCDEMRKEQKLPQPAPGKPSEPQLPEVSTRWIELDKSIGPLSVKRIGLSYIAPRAAIKFDAGLNLSCVTFSLLGLGLSYPINNFSFDIKEIAKNLKFHLDGAALALNVGPVTVGGSLLKVSDAPLQLDGSLIVRVETFSIAAIGSYANLKGVHSLFLFGALQYPLGGPPYFFITGVAFGFGLNRALVIPPINDVHNFPLVGAATNADYLAKNQDPRMMSRKLQVYIHPSPGDFWMAAGIKFTSFGLLDSFVLASVSLGTRFEVALLGLAKLQLPKQRAIANVELALKVVFAPDRGFLTVEAALTENSYILAKEFKLRGGFAFYLWFAGDHAGDFVISIGGYHPRFRVPAHYPRPDLVEFSYRSGSVMIKGYCYFALCPAAIMAGGGLQIVYQAGGIKAWFIAYADFLIQWKPVYYDIAIGISVGVALNLKLGLIRIKLSLELGASVNLYGPPLGGTARISLWIITFTVKFGSARQLPPPLLWESEDSEKSFAKSFLPNPAVTRITIADGLLAEVENGAGVSRTVNPHKLVLNCSTQVPATTARFNGRENAPSGGPDLGVRPMGKSRLYSRLDIFFEPTAGISDKDKAIGYLNQYLTVSATTRSVPVALWGTEKLDTRKPPSDQMIPGAMMGLEIRTQPGPRPWETPVMDLLVLAYERHRVNLSSQTADTPSSLAAPRKTIYASLADPVVSQNRTQIVKYLIKTGRNVMDPEDIQLPQLKDNAKYIFQTTLAAAQVGQYPPRGFREV